MLARIPAAAVVLGLLLSPALGAQRPASDDPPIPAELVRALLAGAWGGAADPTVVVGRTPLAFPGEIVPAAGARVLGGVSFPRGSWIRHAVVVATDAPAGAAGDSLAARLERAGWHRPDEQEMRGFVPSAAERPAVFCRDSLVVGARAEPRPSGGSRLLVDLRVAPEGRRGSPCSEERRRGRLAMHDDAPIPALRAPAGATSTGQSSSARDGERSVSTRLHTSSPPATLVSHYAAQLRDAGWTLRPPLESAEFVAQSGVLTDPQGVRWSALLTAMALPGGEEVDLSLRVVRAAGGGAPAR